MRGWVGIAVLALIALAGVWVWRDYQAWLALGPGGASADVRGWIAVTQQGLAGRDGLDTTRYDKTIAEQKECAFLGGYLPKREGRRPHVGHWIAPHRQLDQFAAPDMKKRGEALFTEAAAQDAERLTIKKSAIEAGTDALFVKMASEGATMESEAGHVHTNDGAMHVIVGAADAATVIETQWGQAHPLAGRGNLPDGYVMVYAPRNERDLVIAQRILIAAIGHAGRYRCINLSAGEQKP
ncbi:MAG: hypothetical protein ABUS57_20560 [Pseudomonadota bacterium]